MWPEQPKRNSFKESLKAVEADIRHANTLAAMLPREYGGFCIQMRLHYSPFAPFLLHWIEWMDFNCTDPVPSFLGLFHILLYKVYVDGKPLVSPRERKATLKEFYGPYFSPNFFFSRIEQIGSKLFTIETMAAVIYPSLRQLQSGRVDSKEETSPRKITEDEQKLSNEDLQRDEECGICMENCRDVVLPNCGHSMCLNCFKDW
ncbi:peroxisome biogenesis factor 10-like isoform X1 [Cucumis melo var. makuwa]|uniref:Peroxisome biogenesis factor 10-like isoform X1 n=1 Tax=Cucumis melo var. makuwa TaxID=1194695 RepID=A0A5A7SXP9_CUCMM|nr:peroxisome biogenesis factor 10-like isoform X1 [Cucumis melo var. makuwa]TYK15689.1 peroxisome biogenesis factor 10-like isoform X1 [Cucumis melo var. makuwa]